jgi:hypothetical protein
MKIKAVMRNLGNLRAAKQSTKLLKKHKLAKRRQEERWQKDVKNEG